MISIFGLFLYLALISGISPLHTVAPTIEHFPYGIFLIFLARTKVGYPHVLVFCMSVFYGFSILYYSSTSEFSAYFTGSLVLLPGLIQTINFVSPLFFFRGNEKRIVRAATHVFWAYILVGILQMTHILTFFEPVFDLLIARFSGSPIGGYRGVTMLETEPARASFVLLMLYITSVSIDRTYFYHKTVALLIGIFVLVSSTTGILITLLYFIGLSLVVALERFSPGRVIVGGTAVFFAFLFIAGYHPKVAIILDSYRSGGFQGVYTSLSAISGGRFLASIESITSILSRPFGSGANPEYLLGEKLVLENVDVKGYVTRVSSRPVSGVLQYLYYFGFILLIPLWLAIRSNVNRARIGMKAFFIILIGLLYSSPSGEIWMIAFCMVLLSTTNIRRPHTRVKR